jgi:ornithine decarboxylase
MAAVLESIASVSEPISSRIYRSAASNLSFAQARELAGRHGPGPLLVVSKSALVRNYQAFRRYLPMVEPYYAAKANPAYPVLRTLYEIGCHVEVCSYGELQMAVAAGFSPELMLHTHPCKTPDNLVNCYNAGVRWFVVDNVREVEKIAQYTPGVDVLLRLAVSGSSSVINLSAKFGAAEHEAISVMRAAEESGLHVTGMSFHVGSQCHSPNDFHNALRQARRVWNRATDAGMRLEVLDIGGGFPAPYRDSELSLESYCQSLAEALDEYFGDLPHVRIIAEPGRGMVADTVTLITRVIGRNVRGGTPWYYIDDGIYGSFSGQVFDHTEFPLLAEDADNRPLSTCVVAGPTCDSSDVVSRQQLLPDLEEGEILLVPTMGAYTNASASPFNGLAVARIVSID